MTTFRRYQPIRVGVLPNSGDNAHLSGARGFVVSGEPVRFEGFPGIYINVVLDNWPHPEGRARAIATDKLVAL